MDDDARATGIAWVRQWAAMLAPLALCLAAVIWLLYAFLIAELFYPAQDPDTGRLYVGIGIDPVSDDEAEAARKEVFQVWAISALAISAHGAVAWFWSRSRVARSAALGMAGCYAVLGLFCAAEGLADPSAPAFFVYAFVIGALSVPIFGGVASPAFAVPDKSVNRLALVSVTVTVALGLAVAMLLVSVWLP
jgi:hypothetical protein